MATSKKPYNEELGQLATEVMDLWQEHLAVCANDPVAKTELIKLLEPQRQLFADWAAMMQNGLNGTGFTASCKPTNSSDASPSVGAEAASAAFDDSALRLAQLAYRVAELESRMAKLESRQSSAPTKTSRAAKPLKS
jgi:hypothetical protein